MAVQLTIADTEQIQNCPRCRAAESMLKTTVRTSTNPLLTCKGFFCPNCSIFIEAPNWADSIKSEDIIFEW